MERRALVLFISCVGRVVLFEFLLLCLSVLVLFFLLMISGVSAPLLWIIFLAGFAQPSPVVGEIYLLWPSFFHTGRWITTVSF